MSAGDLVFDIGANVGNRTDAFLQAGARVVAVEPQPACAARLRERWADTESVVVVEEAVGAAPGTAELWVAGESTISSMAPEWIESVRASGRFGDQSWNDEPISVAVTTLDTLIERHGVPAFCKIDVEGFEESVVAGLSRPLPLVSLEFTPETPARTAAVIERLQELGFDEFTYSLGESMRFERPFANAGDLLADLTALPLSAWGDFYGRSPVQ